MPQFQVGHCNCNTGCRGKKCSCHKLETFCTSKCHSEYLVPISSFSYPEETEAIYKHVLAKKKHFREFRNKTDRQLKFGSSFSEM